MYKKSLVKFFDCLFKYPFILPCFLKTFKFAIHLVTLALVAIKGGNLKFTFCPKIFAMKL